MALEIVVGLTLDSGGVTLAMRAVQLGGHVMKRFYSPIATVAATAALALQFSACSGEQVEPEDENILDDGKYEAWNSANNPAYVDNTFVYEVDKLPTAGKGKPPIPADYWATYKDNINVRWDGEMSLSAAEKFEKAFKKTGLVKTITNVHGIKAHGRKECTKNEECASMMDGSDCAIPRGDTKGACIPTWWGICHGWAPYAISEPAPTKPVIVNGVTFYPGDLEGLMSLVYSSNLPTKFISQRCNKKEPGRDNTGRVVDSECRDMNPGTWHIIVTNFLGLRKQGFVYDRTAFDQVWNQPVEGYDITNAKDGKLVEIKKEEAVRMLGLDMNFASILAEMPFKKGDTKMGEYVALADGEILIKSAGTGDVDMWVKKGMAATEAANDCASTGGTSAEECRVMLKKGEKVFYLLKGYTDGSKASLSVGTKQGTPNYVYNAAAKRFFFVQMEFRYITEAGTARESRISKVAQFTTPDQHEYILETDDAGRVLGGEWVGDSRTAHPDFAWWPTGKPGLSVANGLITFDEVKKLHDESAGVTQGMSPVAEVKELFKNVVIKGVSQYATVGVPANATLKVDMIGSGNADLYVRLGSRPSITSFTCKSITGTSTESCTVKAGSAGGTYYVRARPIATTSTVSVVATITK
ncbi:MAG: hypothetical protein EXR72_05245 [Myxococcales bacterium]|nr:hypothetical protein [Myxococcales bacterium]